MLGWFDRVFDGRDLELLGYLRQRVPANWKLMFENIKDPYHAQPAARLPRDVRPVPGRQPVGDRDGRDRPAQRAGLASAARTRRARRRARCARSDDVQLHDPRLLDPVREFPGAATVVMQTLWPNLIVQQQSNTLAMRQLVPRGPGAVRPALDVLRLRGRRRGDAHAAAAAGQPHGAVGPRVDRRQRGDARSRSTAPTADADGDGVRRDGRHRHRARPTTSSPSRRSVRSTRTTARSWACDRVTPADLFAAYADVLDEGPLDEWPSFFTSTRPTASSPARTSPEACRSP